MPFTTRRSVRATAISLALAALGSSLGGCPGASSERELGLAASGDSAVREAAIIVLVTLDGVPPDEVFNGPDPEIAGADTGERAPAMPVFLREVVPTGTFFGAPGGAHSVGLGSPLGTSLPSYQSLLVGRPTLCLNNECGPPTTETWLGRLHRERSLASGRITVLATWAGLCDGIGADAYADKTCGGEAIRTRWQERFGAGGATPPASTDRAVFELGLDRLEKQDPPAVLWLAWDESDGAGHAGDYPRYLATLGRYDGWLHQLDGVIRRLEAEGRPVLWIVTTDHGRGRGEEWTEHRWNVPGTDRLWLFLRGAGIAAQGVSETKGSSSLLDIRPTLEHWMGLAPVTGPLRGRVLEAAFSPEKVRGSGVPGEPASPAPGRPAREASPD